MFPNLSFVIVQDHHVIGDQISEDADISEDGKLGIFNFYCTG